MSNLSDGGYTSKPPWDWLSFVCNLFVKTYIGLILCGILFLLNKAFELH